MRLFVDVRHMDDEHVRMRKVKIEQSRQEIKEVSIGSHADSLELPSITP
jgi:hypothetical protein